MKNTMAWHILSQNTVPGRIQAPNTILFLLNSWFLYCSSAVKGISSAVRRFTFTICMYKYLLRQGTKISSRPNWNQLKTAWGQQTNEISSTDISSETPSGQLKRKSAQISSERNQLKNSTSTADRWNQLNQHQLGDSPHQPPPKDTLAPNRWFNTNPLFHTRENF